MMTLWGSIKDLWPFMTKTSHYRKLKRLQNMMSDHNQFLTRKKELEELAPIRNQLNELVHKLTNITYDTNFDPDNNRSTISALVHISDKVFVATRNNRFWISEIADAIRYRVWTELNSVELKREASQPSAIGRYQ